MTNNLKEEIDKIIDSFREDCWTVRQSMDYEDQKERAIGVQALASLNTKNAILTLINQKEKEGELRGLEEAKEKVTMLRDVYLVKGQHGALDEDPMADKAIAIRNHLRKEISQDLEDRIKQLKEELKGGQGE